MFLLWLCEVVCDEEYLSPQAVQDTGAKLIEESDINTADIKDRLQQLQDSWEELKSMAANRGQKLEESYAFQQFSASVEEEEAWIAEKQHLLSGGDHGDTMATVQVYTIPLEIYWQEKSYNSRYLNCYVIIS